MVKTMDYDKSPIQPKHISAGR